MAAGKNAAQTIFEQKGFAAVDADELAHSAVENKEKEIIAAFSPEAAAAGIRLLNRDGTLDRRNLGKLIFRKQELIARQEALVHPEINRLLEKFIANHEKSDIVLNATVLYKVPAVRRCDAVVYIDAPWLLRFFRVRFRDKMPALQIFARFRTQTKLYTKYKKLNADIYRVWNTGNLHKLERNIDSVLHQCRQRGF
jgi:dephospho-CoA kinase